MRKGYGIIIVNGVVLGIALYTHTPWTNVGAASFVAPETAYVVQHHHPWHHQAHDHREPTPDDMPRFVRMPVGVTSSSITPTGTWPPFPKLPS